MSTAQLNSFSSD